MITSPRASSSSTAMDDASPRPVFAILVCVFASLGGLFFGYDQGVTGGVLVMDSFLRDFCVDFDKNALAACQRAAAALPPNWRAFATLYNVLFYVGCLGGAVLGGAVADTCGRRGAIFLAGVSFCVGTLWVVLTPAGHHTTVLLGRVVAGVGVGSSSLAIPIFGAEMAPPELRGLLSGFMQMTVVTGLVLANVVNFAVQHVEAGWRITNAVALLPPAVVVLGICGVPESPRWIYKHRGRGAAEATLKKLRQSDHVRRELDAIGNQLALEGNAVAWNELLEPTVRRRVVIAMGLQVLQQATGINPVMTYGAQIFQDVVGGGIVSLLVLSIVNFVSTIPAMRWVDTYGRRSLLLLGAVGMGLGHLVSALSFTIGCNGTTENAGCSDAAGYVMIVAACFFVFNFAISWGPVCWIYPAEIFPLNVRAKAVSLSTMANWGAGAIMIAVPKLFPYLNLNGVFFLFFALCACCGVFVWFYCPETRGILLEDIEALFHSKATRTHDSPKFSGVATPHSALV